MILYIILAVVLLIIDQVTKALVVANFTFVGDTVPIIRDFFHFTYVRNEGGMMGLDIGGNYWLFIVFGFIALGVFGYLFKTTDWKDRRKILYHISLSMLVAGALGNLIDRVFQPDHFVVDFIDFRGIWIYVFNVADMCLSIGISIFMFDQFILDPRRLKADADANRV